MIRLPASRRRMLSAMAIGTAAVLPAKGRGFSLDQLRDETIDPTSFGVVPDGLTDNAAAFEKAVDRAVASGKPLFLPPASLPYRTSRPLRALTGLMGAGRQSCIEVHEPGDFDGERALLHLGWSRSESSEMCRVPLSGIRLVGKAVRTARRSGNPRSCGFDGNGILYDEMVGPLHARDISVSHFKKGIVHANATGHIGGTALDVSNCWFNLYWEVNTADYRYYDCVFTGALFAAYGCHGSNRQDGTDPGGISNLLLSGCHAGFAPYGFWQAEGDGTVGLVGLTLQNSSFEQIGNQAIRLGRHTGSGRKVSNGWDISVPGHTWTDPELDAAAYNAYTILEDAAHPIQEIAVNLDLVQGAPLFVRGSAWRAGYSGYHTRIGDLLEWIEASEGVAGYEVSGQGREKILAPPRRFVAVQPIIADLHVKKTVELIHFERPDWILGATKACLELLGTANNQNPDVQSLLVRVAVDSGEFKPLGFMTLPPGRSDFSFRRWFNPQGDASTHDRGIRVLLEGDVSKISFASDQVTGQVVLVIEQG